MKKTRSLSASAVLILSIICCNYNAFAQCKVQSIVKTCKPVISQPYEYNSYWMSEFTFGKNEKTVEGHFIAFQGEKYQIVFCSSGFSEKVVIKVYSRNSGPDKGRSKVYDSSENTDGSLWKFEPTKSGDYFIEYTIPPSKNGLAKKACVVLLIGSIIDTGAK